MKRKFWQIGSTILNNAYLPGYINVTIYQGFLKGYCTPTLNCYACPGAFASCPIGTLQYFASRHQFPFFLAGFLGVVGTGMGRMSCGWLCPFGFLQDLFKKFSHRVLSLPRWTRYLKYLTLVGVAILLPWFLYEPWFSKLCPAGGIEGAIPWAAAGSSRSPDMAGLDVRSMIGSLFWIKMAILGSLLWAMIFIKRPFCRMFCPLGAIFSLFNRISMVRLRHNTKVCDNCGMCNSLCPVDLDVVTQLDSSECIKCLECTKCPNHAITVSFGFGS